MSKKVNDLEPKLASKPDVEIWVPEKNENRKLTEKPGRPKKQYTLLVDLDKCLGCKACQLACKVENNVDYGIFWTQMNSVGPEGTFPKLDYFFFPKQCQHCADPLCVTVCPTKATYQTEDGVVLIDQDRCYGCQYCLWACPYGARTLNESKGMVEKCILCAGRLERGEKPACVVSCEGNCRFFGDLNDPNSEVSEYLAKHQSRAFRVHPEFETKPSVIYLKPRRGASKL